MIARPLTLLSAAALLLAASASAFHDDTLPLLYEAGGEGGGSYALRLDHAGGDFTLTIVGMGPLTSQSLTLAFYIFNEDREYVSSAAVNGHTTPDRFLLSTPVTRGNAALVPAWLGMEAATAEDSSAESGSHGCPYACLSLRGHDVPAGVYYYLLYVAGVPSHSFAVRAAGGSVVVNAGPAYNLGDADMEGGVNVQSQGPPPAGPQDSTVAAKAIAGAGASIQVDHALFGFFESHDFDFFCAAGACTHRPSSPPECTALGLSCDTTGLSWAGPNGAGGAGPVYFEGAPAGDYTFTVDRKLEAYGPEFLSAETGTWVWTNEDITLLSIADNELP